MASQTQTLTLSSPEISPELHPSNSDRSPTISWPPSASRTPEIRASPLPSISWTPATSQSRVHSLSGPKFRLTSPPRLPPPVLLLQAPALHLLTEEEILASPLIPAYLKPTVLDRYNKLRFVLTTHDRRGTGFQASGARPADRLVAAEQLARMTMVYDWYVDYFAKRKNAGVSVEHANAEAEDDECESMATDILDASFCASGQQKTWEQPCFLSPLCLMSKEKDAAELAAWCLRHFEKSRASGQTQQAESLNLSADHILRIWEGPANAAREPVPCATKHDPRNFNTGFEWPDSHNPGKRRCRTRSSVCCSEGVRTIEPNDLNYIVWKVAADEAGSAKELMDVEQPPMDSKAGFYRIEKLTSQSNVLLEQSKWIWNSVRSGFRQTLHPWCLRCYRTRCRFRNASYQARLSGMLDMAFMLIGMLIILAVEWYIACTDERIPADAPFADGTSKAWSLFLEPGVQEGIRCWEPKEDAPMRGRHRSVSCPF